MTTVIALAGASGATAATTQSTAGTDPQAAPATAPATNPGGREYGAPDPMETPTVPGTVAQIVNGVAYAPEAAPEPVKELIWSANRIVGMPYRYGGGHQDFEDDGYDCSGTVSYALHGGGLLRRPRDSSDFARYGAAGTGQWVTVYTNPGHAYMTVAGIRLDTSAADDPRGDKGPRWRPLRESDRGFKRRHPKGL
jgi:cell wall-associated NlpC family hydrolase